MNALIPIRPENPFEDADAVDDAIGAVTREEAIRRLAYENEIARRRALNNIPDGFLTPNWLELAIAKDWTLVRGEPSENRARAEAEARRVFDDAYLAMLDKGQRRFVREASR